MAVVWPGRDPAIPTEARRTLKYRLIPFLQCFNGNSTPPPITLEG